jgi:DNA-directed RNA polymerase specialized sigma subunit, sigma24 homolog
VTTQRPFKQPAAQADEARLAIDALSALSTLDRVDRAALRLTYWRGLSENQVARELALPLATVERCVARGMRELAARLLCVADDLADQGDWSPGGRER